MVHKYGSAVSGAAAQIVSLRTEQSPMPQIQCLSQYRSEDVIPKGCTNAVVSRRKFMMALVMFEQ
jgi:hypothetical protein